MYSMTRISVLVFARVGSDCDYKRRLAGPLCTLGEQGQYGVHITKIAEDWHYASNSFFFPGSRKWTLAWVWKRIYHVDAHGDGVRNLNMLLDGFFDSVGCAEIDYGTCHAWCKAFGIAGLIHERSIQDCDCLMRLRTTHIFAKPSAMMLLQVLGVSLGWLPWLRCLRCSRYLRCSWWYDRDW